MQQMLATDFIVKDFTNCRKDMASVVAQKYKLFQSERSVVMATFFLSLISSHNMLSYLFCFVSLLKGLHHF